jgi:hypothetical protein
VCVRAAPGERHACSKAGIEWNERTNVCGKAKELQTIEGALPQTEDTTGQPLTRATCAAALDVLVQITLNEKAPPNARVAAANTLLDRAYGKAPTFSTSDTQAFKRAIDMTDDELAAIAGSSPAYPSKIRYLVPCPYVSICNA